MNGPVTIRAARAEDAGELARMRVESALERRPGAPEDGALLAASLQAFAAGLAAGSLQAWIAWDGERAIGAAALMFCTALPRYGREQAALDARVRNVYVEPAYRRRGIATALTRSAIAAAQAAGVDRLTLGASEMGRQVYARLGFVQKADEMIFGGE